MGRPCTICEHDDRGAIDRALVAGEPFRQIAARSGTSATSLVRHKNEHLAIVATDDEAVTSTEPVREPVRPAPLTGSILHEAKALRSEAMDLLAKAKRGIPLTRDGRPVLSTDGHPMEAIDFGAARGLITSAAALLELEAKLLGELQTGTTVNIVQSPAWVELRDIILGALGPHPEALLSVVQAMETHQHGRPAIGSGGRA